MHIPYEQILGRSPDFDVTYHIYSYEEGGRHSPVYQGIRWNFSYADKGRNGYHMIWPEFLNSDSSVIVESNIYVPTYGKAHMWIIDKDFRPYHRQHLTPGTRGYFREGPHQVGVCEVTRLISLYDLPVDEAYGIFPKQL